MHRAAVIGAGLAGLAAADGLHRAGVEVVVLEARERVGGRVWSQRLPNGAIVEMGAEFILPGNTVVEATAERLGLGLWAKGMAYGRREPRGTDEPVSEDDLRAAAADHRVCAFGRRTRLGRRPARPPRSAARRP